MPHLFHTRKDTPYSEGSFWSLGLEHTIVEPLDDHLRRRAVRFNCNGRGSEDC